jgi:hypothetical protein
MMVAHHGDQERDRLATLIDSMAVINPIHVKHFQEKQVAFDFKLRRIPKTANPDEMKAFNAAEGGSGGEGEGDGGDDGDSKFVDMSQLSDGGEAAAAAAAAAAITAAEEENAEGGDGAADTYNNLAPHHGLEEGAIHAVEHTKHLRDEDRYKNAMID